VAVERQENPCGAPQECAVCPFRLPVPDSPAFCSLKLVDVDPLVGALRMFAFYTLKSRNAHLGL
jgi:hypothetical protein